MIQGWNLTQILPVGTSANTFRLPTNCYFCTAAALQSMDCNTLSRERDLMQYDTGDFDEFKELFPYPISHRVFTQVSDARQFLMGNLPKHNAVALSYLRSTGSGHSIVVFRTHMSVVETQGPGGPGVAVYDNGGSLRHIDYQKENPQPEDGLIPENDLIYNSSIVRLGVFWRT
ncbi:MAG: hypothetical protein AAF170_04370 [Bacteroidota bacterium]